MPFLILYEYLLTDKNIKKVASISTEKGFFCIGSIDSETIKTFLIQYINKEIIIDWEIPSPSFELLKPQLIEFNNDIFILVNNSIDSTTDLWKLDLSSNKWEKIQSFKFKSNKNLLLTSQSDGTKKHFFF